MIKGITKFLIFTLFILERFYFYKEFKAVETDVKDLHHEILSGYEVDFGKVNNKYDTHQLFSIPFTKKLIDGLKNKIIHWTNLNQTLLHESHMHKDDPTHAFKNKVLDAEIKFNFYFLTAYDLLMTGVLIAYLYNDSFAGNFLLLGDSAMKVLNIGYRHIKDYRLSSFYYMLYTFIKDVTNKDFRAMWKDSMQLVDKEKQLAFNIALCTILFLQFSYNFTTNIRDFIFGKTGKHNIQDSMEMAAKRIHEVVEEIESKTGSPQPKVLKEEKEEEQPRDLAQLKTLETEEDINSEPQEQNFEKIDKKSKKLQHRNLTPSKRRREKANF